MYSQVKAALTRALNKEHRMLPYHLDDISKGRKKAAAATGAYFFSVVIPLYRTRN